MHSALVDSLASEAERVVASLVPAGTRCALVGFPNHDNAGDSAIWLGERMLLERIAAEVVYVCDVRSYSPDALRAVLGHGMILLHGGGNLGDLWERQQRLRERVLADFPGVPVVQLPQSIHFQEPSNLARFADALRAHGDTTLLARERQSLERARAFAGGAVLCPDLAFLLGSIEVDEPKTARILWLARTDREALFSDSDGEHEDVLRLDWIHPVPDEPVWSEAATQALARIQARTRQIEHDPASASAIAHELAADCDTVAAQRVERGCRILSRGEVVVTDRLHGHILSLLLGLPNVVLNQSYGKTRSFYETWTRSCEQATWAGSPPEAIAAAHRLLLR